MLLLVLSLAWNYHRNKQFPPIRKRLIIVLVEAFQRQPYRNFYTYLTIRNFCYFFRDGTRSEHGSSQKPTHYAWGKISHTAQSCCLADEEAISKQTVPGKLLHCGGKHRQLDLTIWVEFDWISFGTISHTLNSLVNGVTILENYWGKTTLPLIPLSQQTEHNSIQSLSVFLSSLSPRLVFLCQCVSSHIRIGCHPLVWDLGMYRAIITQ